MTMEQGKKLLGMVCFHTHPIVTDGKNMEVSGLFIAYADLTQLLTAILQGIIQQVSKDSEKPQSVGPHQWFLFRPEALYLADAQLGGKLILCHSKKLPGIDLFNVQGHFLRSNIGVHLLDKGHHLL